MRRPQPLPRTLPTLHRILIVDDDETVRTLLRATLPEDAYEVVEAQNGDQALDAIAREPLDLVLLDWKMPGVAGSQVLDEIKNGNPALPVIVLTAEHQAPQRALAEALGVDVFLTKPFSPRELLESIEHLLSERRSDQPS